MKDNAAAKKNDKVSNKYSVRAMQFYKDYISFGTLEKVAKKHGVSRERVRQILNGGSSAGLFKYPMEKSKPPSSITAEQLRKDYLLYGSTVAVAKHYGISIKKIQQLVREYNLSFSKLRSEIGRLRTLEGYKNMVKEIGHHPTVTEMYQNAQGRALCSRIQRYYGCMDTFRKTYSYPTPKKGNPNFTKRIMQVFQTNKKNILKCLKIKPNITMAEIVDTLGIAKEAVRVHLLKLKKENIVDYTKKNATHYYFLINPEKLAEEDKQLKLSDLKPAINSKDKAFIDKLSRLYLRYGDLNAVSKKLKKDKTALIEQIDHVLKEGHLYPIKNRRELILTLRIKRSYDKIGRVDLTAEKYGVSYVAINKYLRYGNRAGLFKYPEPIKKRKYKIRPATTKRDRLSKGNIKHILKIKREYDKLGSIEKIGEKHGLSHENIRQMLMAGNDLGLFEFPPKKKRLYTQITKEKLEADLLKYESIPKLSRHYEVSIGQGKEAIEKHGISLPQIMFELSRREALKTYQDLVKELGHHPSTPEIKKRHGYLLVRIKKIWGSIYDFRQEYGFPNPQNGSKR